MTIFGATGDLTRRKLLPALYDLAAQNLLPDEFAIVGFGRRAQDEAEFRQSLGEGIREFARLPFDRGKMEMVGGAASSTSKARGTATRPRTRSWRSG